MLQRNTRQANATSTAGAFDKMSRTHENAPAESFFQMGWPPEVCLPSRVALPTTPRTGAHVFRPDTDAGGPNCDASQHTSSAARNATATLLYSSTLGLVGEEVMRMRTPYRPPTKLQYFITGLRYDLWCASARRRCEQDVPALKNPAWACRDSVVRQQQIRDATGSHKICR